MSEPKKRKRKQEIMFILDHRIGRRSRGYHYHQNHGYHYGRTGRRRERYGNYGYGGNLNRGGYNPRLGSNGYRSGFGDVWSGSLGELGNGNGNGYGSGGLFGGSGLGRLFNSLGLGRLFGGSGLGRLFGGYGGGSAGGYSPEMYDRGYGNEGIGGYSPEMYDEGYEEPFSQGGGFQNSYGNLEDGYNNMRWPY